MSKDTIGWIDSDRMKASIAALRALRKKPVPAPAAPAVGRTPSTSVDALFVDEEVPPKNPPNRSEMRPITDVSKRAYAEAYAVTTLGPSDEVEDKDLYLRETQDIQAFPQHVIAKTPVREPSREIIEAPLPSAALEVADKAPVVPFDAKHEVTDRLELGELAEGEEAHVDKSLAQALDLLKNASNAPYELAENDEYYDISAAFTQLPTPRNTPAAPAPVSESPVTETSKPSNSAAKSARETMEIDPFEALDEIDRIADQRDSEPPPGEYELDEFGIPTTSTRKDFATGAFDSVDRASVLNWDKKPFSKDPFDRIDGRLSGGLEGSIRRSLEAVTAETPTVAVDEDGDPFAALPTPSKTTPVPELSTGRPELHHLPTANVPTLEASIEEETFSQSSARDDQPAPKLSSALSPVAETSVNGSARITTEAPVFDPFANLDEELEAEAQALKPPTHRPAATFAKPSAVSDDAFSPVLPQAAPAVEESSVESGYTTIGSIDVTAEVARLGDSDFSPDSDEVETSHDSLERSSRGDLPTLGLALQPVTQAVESVSDSADSLDMVGSSQRNDDELFASAEVEPSYQSSANPFEAVSAFDLSLGDTREETSSSAAIESTISPSFEPTVSPAAAVPEPEGLEAALSNADEDAEDVTGVFPIQAADSPEVISSFGDTTQTRLHTVGDEELGAKESSLEALPNQPAGGDGAFGAEPSADYAVDAETSVDRASTTAQDAVEAPEDPIPALPLSAGRESDDVGRWSAPPPAMGAISSLNWLRTAAKWIRSLDESNKVFVADADGLSILSDGVDEDTIALAIATRNAIVGTRNLADDQREGQLNYPVAESTICHMVWRHSEYGVLTIGVLSKHTLPAPAFRPLQLEFARAIDELPIG